MSAATPMSRGTETPSTPVRSIGIPVLLGAAGVVVGVLTSYGQEQLPTQLHSLANAAGPWTLVMFLLAMTAPGRLPAAVSGFGVFAGMLWGYDLGNQLRGFMPQSTQALLFWMGAGLVVGPVLGLGAHYLRHQRSALAAAGLGGMSAVLIGEGIYGLRNIADTTYPPFWWGEMALGVAMLIAVAWWRLRGAVPRLLAVGIAVAGTAVFVAIIENVSLPM